MSYFNYYIPKNKAKFSFEFANEFLLCDPVFMCIGNSNVVADCFGPMVGELLKQKYKIKNVYGTLENNITSKNLNYYYNKIKLEHPLKPIIVVDSAIASENEVGLINFMSTGCLPAVKTNNKVMGDYSLLGKVNVTGISGLMFLKTVKFKMVLNMASMISESIFNGIILKNKINKIG